VSAPIRNLSDLDRLAAVGAATLYPDRLKILVGSATCGVAMGAREVEDAARRAVDDLGLDAVVARTGCIGFCGREPLLDLVLPSGPRVSYGNMTAEKARELLAAYAADGDTKPELALGRFEKEDHVSTGEVHEYAPPTNGLSAVPVWQELDFYRHQQKVILRNSGSIDPRSLEESLARGAYRGAVRALTELTPEEAIDEVSKSGLRGRGGAAFPTGQKWRLARAAEADAKYVVCNADEGAPGSYMDRNVLEGDPHAVIEGMLIGSYAVGAREGYLYVRSEYPLAIEILQHAVAEAEKHGLLGSDIFGSGWSFRLTLRRGAGAYVVGEETALIESIEGHAGEPRPRPPYPVTEGLWGKPTVVNNVKTWASVAPILTRGADWYAAMGTKGTTGTTVFSLEGVVRNPGLVEVPFGLTLRELVYDIGGGLSDDRSLKAVQAGGPSQGCLPPSMLDLAIDADDRPGETVVMGTGGVIVLDDTTCMVDMARYLVGFFMEESCGKCAPCREGTRQMSLILTRLCEGKGRADDLPLLERLGRTMKVASSCGLGNVAYNPVLTALRHFPEEFQAHLSGTCPACMCRGGVAAR
jgi:NADH:ubiquinone oxidoreductase subunit F (NADH-binding)/(2Fe-2S) ferredoxin